jgi:ferredoxin
MEKRRRIMKDRRMLGILAFIVWWGIWASLLTGTPFKLGEGKILPPNEGVGTIPFVGHDIKNLPRLSFLDFASFIYGNQPSRGPKGTTFDMVNRRNEVPQLATLVHNATRFGSPEMVEGFWGPVNPQKVKLPDPEMLTKFIKDMARYLGAVDVGIADLGPNPETWFFEDDVFGYPLQIKRAEHRYAIVSLNEEKQSLHPYPTGWNADSINYYSKVSKNYFDDDVVAGQLSEMIRNMGYHAWGHNNANVKSVPVAIMAGLGEYGRFGNLITLNWGSNVRINTVTTDLPLVPDKPVYIGVGDVCAKCTRCVDYCPMKAIPIEEMEFMGVRTWKPNFWKCRRATVVGLDNLTDASTCTLCRDVCPFVKDTKSVAHKLGRYMVSRSSIGRRLVLSLDYLLYSRWNRHNLQQVMTERRTRLREANARYPEGDWCNDWFTLGATDEKGRHVYRQKNPAGIVAVAKGGIGLINPFYTKSDLEDPTFGKWPSWEDPWGRKVTGYEEGKEGAPRLNLRPIVKMIGTAVLSGVGGSPMATYALSKMPADEARKQEPDTWCGAGFDTGCNPRSNSYAW